MRTRRCDYARATADRARQCALASLSDLEIERGGDATYHGPGQLVGYPICFLRPGPDPAQPFGEQDLHGFLRAIEEGLLHLLRLCGVACDRKPKYTGVWTADQTGKLVSLGVAVRRWVTSHGFALNVTTDLSRFWRSIRAACRRR